jgi:(E)-4-hydroxy-3-methylbut-2-enyl-diphosphate synthase
MGMVESAMEFLRICRSEDYHQIVLSMKSSNPQVMVQAYRLLIQTMNAEFGEIYPLHLGVTEAGDGEEGRIKSAVGIGTLLEDGIGDTIRVSLTEDPEFEIPVCRDIVKRYAQLEDKGEKASVLPDNFISFWNPFEYQKRVSEKIGNIGTGNVPVVIADLSKVDHITPKTLLSVGYRFNLMLNLWRIADAAADYIFIDNQKIAFTLPKGLQIITPYNQWAENKLENSFPVICLKHFLAEKHVHPSLNFVLVDCYSKGSKDYELIDQLSEKKNVVLCLSSHNTNAMQSVRRMCIALQKKNISHPIVFVTNSNWQTADEHLIHFATETGALYLEGFGYGIWLGMSEQAYSDFSKAENHLSGRQYADSNGGAETFLNNTAFSILQATRTRISKTEYISCPSCGRTLFELQETTQKIRTVTSHLKGVKIAIMGCIVNGPGEMADADFGYVGSGPGKITLYKGKEVVKRNIDSAVAVDELINLLKENNAWVEPSAQPTE